MKPIDFVGIYRAESGKIIASLTLWAKDLELAEDAMQEAYEQALLQWPQKGLPQSPASWLHTVAKRKVIDRIRQLSSRRKPDTLVQLEQHYSADDAAEDETNYAIPDERLRLIFTCCHPALNSSAQVALTLRTLCGLSVREISRAFLTSEKTMLQRITRAKRKIRDAGIPYEVPDQEHLTERLNAVLSVIYLVFNESFNAYEGQTLSRKDLAREAIRLASILKELMPLPEVTGLLCLLQLSDARTPARSSESESYIPLEKQDRKLWDKSQIEEAKTLLIATLAKGNSGPYQIQAAISALHATAPSWEETDWAQICLLYENLYALNPSPVTKLNQLVAVAQTGKVELAYKEVLNLDNQLADYQPYHAVKANFECRLERFDEAKSSYRQAISKTQNGGERDFLLKQLATIG
ncbi:RNA polymerase sigma factor [Alteromonadaceae bacterium M269]|nr:RNA polymerase sigma factor [Alteromonadaceae bacterium M269]